MITARKSVVQWVIAAKNVVIMNIEKRGDLLSIMT